MGKYLSCCSMGNTIGAYTRYIINCSYRLKFFVAKDHLRSSCLSNCSLLGSRFARSCSTRPSQRSKYTEGVALRMCICITVQRLSRKCVQNKKYAGNSLNRDFCHGGHCRQGHQCSCLDY